ncbi:DEAD/DEAH box helicase [Streptomyces platensis]|uniref:RNA helicase n=1 Tax=Streptomyces platensis TaxID=58346 RepID=A0AAE6NMJ4_STRPT|nr:DEAD/DEAH box helicase [Streptomyces platensis]OSY45327.1 DEAD-box ATP-dependent RNA helicase CshA [Streptomyces platensis]QEV54560.1 DEAD/DEAH box helicase [Streptomyces platensis]
MPERWQWSRPTGRLRPARTNPYEGAVRPPSPPHAASHRRGKILSTFRDLGIFPETAEALEAVGIISPFPIQELTLPVALSGNDVIGQAKTGTGKTLGFGLPLLERVTVPADVEAGRAKPEQLTEAPQALVVVPTRELCQQVTNDLLTAGKVRNVRVLAIYGGRAYEPQVEALKKGVDVVVGTPGRLLDLAGQRKLNLSEVKSLVLDEADEMLDLGFLPDVEKIIQLLPAKRQTMLFSATMPGQVISLARRYMSQPTHIRATAPDDEGQTVRNTTQHVFRAHSMDKPEMVARILQAEGRGLAMVFCRTKRTAADIADQLARRGFASGAVHGDLGQGAREQALRAFRNGKVDVLVCTDVAARGIDVEGVTHVINYQSPEEEKTYLHRIGRTGRAGAKGTAVTLVDWDDIPRWKLINKALDLAFDEPEETYSTSPHLYEQLNIPAGTKGVLPRNERTRAGLAAEEVEDLGETGGRGRGPRKGAVVEEERPPRTRTPRQRRRTRGGTAQDGPADATTQTTGSPAAEGTERAEGTDAAGPRQPRRRRRTRSAQSGAVTAPVTEAATPAAEVTEPAAVVTEAPAEVAKAAGKVTKDAAVATKAAPKATKAPAVVTEAPAEAAPPRRRRSRVVRPVETESFQTVETAARALAAERSAAAAAVTEPVEAPAKPRRRTRSAAKAAVETAPAVVTETVAAETVVDAPAKPKRTRKTAATKAAEATVDAAEGAVEAPAKPKRTRKTAAAKAAEATVDTAEGTEAAPAKPKRTRKSAAAAKATADAPAAEDAPAKPKRTRKSAAAKPAADAAEAAEAKPVRRRTRAKATATEATPEG